MTEGDDFAADYATALEEHLRIGSEASLEQAHDLGRRALTAGLGVLDVVARHERAVHAATQDHHDESETVREAALPFLLQALAALDMATRGFVEAAERVRVEQAHLAQLQRLADAFTTVYVDQVTDDRLHRLTGSMLAVLPATTGAIELGTRQAATPDLPEPAHAATPAALLAARGASALHGTSEAGAPGRYWVAARVDRTHTGGDEKPGLVIAWRDTEFDAFDAAVLTQFAQLTAAAARNADLYEGEHQAAVALQSSLLPSKPVTTSGLDIAAGYQPSGRPSGVGGDWFDVIHLPGDRIALVIGDVAGHGIPAAAFMGQISVAVRAYAVEDHEPAAVLTHVDRLLAAGSEHRLATLVYGTLDPDGTLRYANAGHPPPLLIAPDGRPTYLHEALSQPIGVRAPELGHRTHRTRLEPGATLVLYTDGLIEQRDRSLDAGMAALGSLAAEHATGSPEALCSAALRELVAVPPADDACILAVRRHRPERTE